MPVSSAPFVLLLSCQKRHRILSSRFCGAATSVTRSPKLPLIRTTSPRATILSPTIRSTGSATCRSSSTTSPGPSFQNFAQRQLPASKTKAASSSTSRSNSSPGPIVFLCLPMIFASVPKIAARRLRLLLPKPRSFVAHPNHPGSFRRLQLNAREAGLRSTLRKRIDPAVSWSWQAALRRRSRLPRAAILPTPPLWSTPSPISGDLKNSRNRAKR